MRFEAKALKLLPFLLKEKAESDRLTALWAIKALRDEPLPLFAAATEREAAVIPEQQEPEVELRQMTEGRNVVEDYGHIGLTLREHPIAFLRREPSGTEHNHLRGGDDRARRPVGLRCGPSAGEAEAGERQGRHVHNDRGRDRSCERCSLALAVREAASCRSRGEHEGGQRPHPAGGGVVHLAAQQLFDLSGDLSGLADRDIDFKLPTGRGDEFAHGSPGSPDSRDRPKRVPEPRDIFVRDFHIDTLKVKARNFQ